jgi:regulatory protein
MKAASAPLNPRRRAMDLLARREHSYFELQRKLTQRGFLPDEITHALDKLQAERLLDDRRFAFAYTESRMGRGYGPVRIKEELLQRGVAPALCFEALAEFKSAVPQKIAEVLVKKYGEQPPLTFAEKASRMRFLQYRGFEPDHIKQVLAGDYEHE